MAQRERYAAPHRNDSADKLAPLSRWTLPAAGAPWLIKNLGRDERGHWVRCPTTSTTICGHQFGEGAAPEKEKQPEWTVTDDWPDEVPITEAEIEVFEAWFGDLFDELFSTRH